MQKISVGAGFTCPNRDGSKGVGGCTFCNNNGFTPGYVRESPDDICLQIETGMEFLKRRYPRTLRWVAYFQAYSNTYGELQALIKAYQTALSHPDIDGLVIGTRPDCVADELLDYLAELSKSHLIELELGIESTNDAALARVNRGMIMPAVWMPSTGRRARAECLRPSDIWPARRNPRKYAGRGRQIIGVAADFAEISSAAGGEGHTNGQ